MSQKKFFVEGVGELVITKKRKVKRINLRVAQNSIKITQPFWLPYASGVGFAVKNRQWITKQQYLAPKCTIKDGQKVGKEHIVRIKKAKRLFTVVKNSEITIYLPTDKKLRDKDVIEVYKSAIKKALKIEATKHLLPRLHKMAELYGYHYSIVKIAALRSRWGSCNNKGSITLSSYLMAGDWELIDYVIAHELAHTHYMHHKKEFWSAVAEMIPDFKERQKKLKVLQKQISQLY
ncbi:M48 family metallopeptidase [Candidatus Saccharibacteria bacterium]|jgi:hypothetical protein|nr:M48 family metallopeptidase [Candidatus Saccharibacteria bacterium]HOR23487.1 M48 family metallopeptidase [Candidatus Saccharibacteria bacterium]